MFLQNNGMTPDDDVKLVEMLRNKNDFNIWHYHCFVFYKNIQWFPQICSWPDQAAKIYKLPIPLGITRLHSQAFGVN